MADGIKENQYNIEEGISWDLQDLKPDIVQKFLEAAQ